MHHAKKGHRVISMDILEHLQKLYPALTKKQKTIADYLIANPEEISYITLAQLSHQTGTSELTLLRFCQKLGYSNFLDLKEQFRDYTQKMIKQASSSSFFLPERISGEASERERILHEICIPQCQQVMVILPFVLCVIVVQRHAQVGTVVGRVGAAPKYTVYRVDGAAADAAVRGGLALVQAAQQDI